MTVMHQLDGKGVLRRARAGRADVFVAALSRDEYAQARAEAQVGELVDQYGDVALAHFARHMSQLDPKRREQIRRLAGG
jgi:predicted transcriptional regulator